MSNYDWSKLSDENLFRDLCNAIIKEEFAWPLVTISRGKDQGIDAEYTGDYKSKKGRWIFQYKWLNPSNGNPPNVSSLKSTLIGGSRPEIQYVYQNHNPDHYVVLTNISLTLKNKRDIIKYGKNIGIKDVIIYDQADLDVFLYNFPSLVRKFINDQPPILEHYSDKFSSELMDKNSIYYCGSDSEFLGRKEEIQILEEFISSNQQQIALIKGEGGIGKTRLIIELAKAIEQNNNNIKFRFVRDLETLTFGDLTRDLPLVGKNGKNVQVLVFDDAHKFPRDVISQLDYFTRNKKLVQVKVILITRPELSDQVLNLLPLYGGASQPFSLDLKNIGFANIVKIISSKIKDEYIIRNISSWARKGRWTPLIAKLVITESIKSQGKTFKSATIGSNVLSKIFNGYLNGLDNDVKDLLEIVSLIEPFYYQDQDLRTAIKTFLGWEESKLLTNIDKLVALADPPFIEIGTWGAPKMRIRPDVFSDWLRDRYCYSKSGKVTEKCKRLLHDLLPIATEQILTNLAQAEFDKEEKILDPFWDEIRSKVLSMNNFERSNLMKVIKKVALYRPKDSLDIVSTIIANKQPAFTPPSHDWFEFKHEHVLNDIPEILGDIGYHEAYYTDAIKELFGLASSGYSYTENDSKNKLLELSGIIFRRSLKFNQKLLNFVRANKNKFDAKQKKILYDLLKKQFATEIHYSFSHPDNPRTFSWTTYPIRLTYSKKGFDELKHFRGRALREVLTLFNESENNDKCEVLKVISGILHGLIYQYHPFGNTPLTEDKSYPLEPELGKIILFLKKTVKNELKKKNPDFRVLDEVIGCLNVFRDKQTKYKVTLQQLRGSIKESDTYRLYDQLLAEHKDRDDWSVGDKDYLKNPAIKRIVKSYLQKPEYFAVFFETMLSLREGWIFGSVKKLAMEIGVTYPEFAEAVIKTIVSHQLRNLSKYGGYFLIGIRKSRYPLSQKILSYLVTLQDILAARVVVQSFDRYWVYDFQSKVVKDIASSEIDFLREIKAMKDPDFNAEFAHAASTFLYLDQSQALELLLVASEAIGSEGFILAESIAQSLDPKDHEFRKEDLEVIERIFMNFIQLSDLDRTQMYWHIEQVLEFILRYDPEFIVTFYEERIKYKNSLPEGTEYDAVPYKVEFPTISDRELQLRLCRRIRDWVVEKNWFRFEVLRFIRNFGFSQDVLEEALREWILNNDDNADIKHEKIVFAAYLLRDFEDSDWLYGLLSLLLEKASEYESSDTQYRDIMGEIHGCINTGGGWGDSKHQSVIRYLTDVLNNQKLNLGIKTKKFIKDQIKQHRSEAEHMNNILNADWE